MSRPRPFVDLRRAAGYSFFFIAFAGRLPVAMIVVGMLTMVTAVRGSIVDAGIASATVGLASGLGGPLVGDAADRWGQRWVLTGAAVLNACAIIGAVLAIQVNGPLWAIVLACALVGVTGPQISPLTRARWLALLDTFPEGEATEAHASAAMSYEGMADELTFLFGPILVGLLATLLTPAAPLVLAAALTLVFVSAFAWHATAPKTGTSHKHHRTVGSLRPFLKNRVLLPVVGMFTMGAFFGATLTALTEFMSARSAEAQTGLVYGAMGLTSAICALAVAAVPVRVPLWRRWLVGACIIAIAAIALPGATELWQLVVLLMVAGIGSGPTLVTIFRIGATVAPRGRLTTTMALLSSGVVVGQAVATGVSGSIAHAGGYPAVAVVVVAAAIAGFALSLANAAVSRR
ncbi:MFS transporter [Pseudarthrobacter sp. S6]|uniref:MFS transporter n=1 Tax=Pseudarthrobacter sp. S6 TaxID=3418420 RepID=UPI003CEF6F04